MDNSNVKNIWNNWSETWYQKYRTEEVITKIINNPESVFHPITWAMLKSTYSNLNGKRICVPSSGNNHAVFAFHLMGASVTSVDISERQLEHSAEIANKNSWDIEFVCDDTRCLGTITSNEYDFVYTSNGVHIWIDDLNSMYKNIYRILKSNGNYLMFDVHPFTRPFGDDIEKLTVVRPYNSTGPILIENVPRFTWRMQDLMNAMISSGLCIHQLEEMYAEDGSFWVDESEYTVGIHKQEQLDKLCDWQRNPLAALPQWLSIKAAKHT
ncbi:class I SAM-dependent methyltransferase [Paenibacillus sp. EC2-1]|uniref:class I SAM-dependent methyltransferase n=1 Tax=Paenibacillus sp. EC2-1 TaxID=3388665 RepID=UPI003BEF1787